MAGATKKRRTKSTRRTKRSGRKIKSLPWGINPAIYLSNHNNSRNKVSTQPKIAPTVVPVPKIIPKIVPKIAPTFAPTIAPAIAPKITTKIAPKIATRVIPAIRENGPNSVSEEIPIQQTNSELNKMDIPHYNIQKDSRKDTYVINGVPREFVWGDVLVPYIGSTDKVFGAIPKTTSLSAMLPKTDKASGPATKVHDWLPAICKMRLDNGAECGAGNELDLEKSYSEDPRICCGLLEFFRRFENWEDLVVSASRGGSFWEHYVGIRTLVCRYEWLESEKDFRKCRYAYMLPDAPDAPAKTAPPKTVPAQTVPAQTVPAKTVPAKTVPVQTIKKFAITAAGVLILNCHGNSVAVTLFRHARGPSKGWLDVPGGLVDAGESPVAAAVRELYEESAKYITVTERELVGNSTRICRTNKNGGYMFFTLVRSGLEDGPFQQLLGTMTEPHDREMDLLVHVPLDELVNAVRNGGKKSGEKGGTWVTDSKGVEYRLRDTLVDLLFTCNGKAFLEKLRDEFRSQGILTC